mmetsp:Transcript_6400/g.15527  ORF Transcript_6400/g.15527 Transcript_6400/m.15527 type:complete len:94 (+) Transcript_6400:6044-6325(+)
MHLNRKTYSGTYIPVFDFFFLCESSSFVNATIFWNNLTVVVLIHFKHAHIQENSRSHQNSLFLCRNVFWESNMVGIFLATAFVFPPRPQRVDH